VVSSSPSYCSLSLVSAICLLRHPWRKERGAIFYFVPDTTRDIIIIVIVFKLSGYEDRIKRGIDWTLVEQAAKYHKDMCREPDIATITFSEALQNKINRSIMGGFLNENSGLTLDQQWELLLPITLWDNEKFANKAGKICFQNDNSLTDDMLKLIKKAVKQGDRNVLKEDLKSVSVLRVNGAQVP
jgi:hypothetical protein